jgi:hypothetical protein
MKREVNMIMCEKRIMKTIKIIKWGSKDRNE